jgi:2,3-bisphosphoglycerate-independent phosphoglycerate mutase
MCKACRHILVNEINTDIINGGSLRKVAEKYGLSKSTVERHKASCMSKDFAIARELAQRDLEIAQASELEAEASARSLRASSIMTGVQMAAKLNEAIERADYLYAQAIETEDYNIAIRSADLTIKVIREYTKLSAEAREREKIREEHLKNDWAKIRSILVKVLDKYPEVKEELDEQLSGVGSSVFS